jgi:colanic acid biosynthesis glycosyl transferase WcaI
MRDRLESKGVAGRKLSVIRNWVDIEKIRPVSGDNPYRRELNLPADCFIVQYAGNIGAKQALDVVLEAASRLQGTDRIVFVIAGEGPEKARLQLEYGHLPNVLFLGLQPEERLCEFLNLADLHILPQTADAEDLVLPSKLGGMLASGKPCLVMAGPGSELAEFVADAALRVPPGEPQRLAAEIRRVFEGEVVFDAECQKRLTEKLRSDVNLGFFLETLTRSVSANEPPVYMGSGQPRLAVERPQPLGPA